MLYQIAYVSTPTASLDDLTLSDIEFAAGKNNFVDDISGLLLAAEHLFFQYFEGPEDRCRALYGRLLMDRRHTDLRVLREGAMQERLFGEWSMKVYSMSAAEVSRFTFDPLDARARQFLLSFEEEPIRALERSLSGAHMDMERRTR